MVSAFIIVDISIELLAHFAIYLFECWQLIVLLNKRFNAIGVTLSKRNPP